MGLGGGVTNGRCGLLNFIFYKDQELRTDSKFKREGVTSFHFPTKSLSLILEKDFLAQPPTASSLLHPIVLAGKLSQILVLSPSSFMAPSDWIWKD